MEHWWVISRAGHYSRAFPPWLQKTPKGLRGDQRVDAGHAGEVAKFAPRYVDFHWENSWENHGKPILLVDGLGRRIFSENDTHLGLIQVAKPDGQGSRGWRQIVNSQLHLDSSASSARFGGVETPYDWDTPRRSVYSFFFELATIWCDLMVPRDNWQIFVKWLLVETETPACRGRIYRAATWNHHFAPHLSAEMGGTHWLSTQIRNSRNSRLVDGFKHFFGPTARQPLQG